MCTQSKVFTSVWSTFVFERLLSRRRFVKRSKPTRPFCAAWQLVLVLALGFTTVKYFRNDNRGEQYSVVFDRYTSSQLTATPMSEYSSRSRMDGWEAAYVSFCNGAAYIPLMEVVIDAVHSFSTYPILVYLSSPESIIPEDWLKRFPNLVVYVMPQPSLNPWFDKLRAILLANVRRGVILEADTIISPRADHIFTVLRDLPANSLQVIAPQHPDIRPSKFAECDVACHECCVNTYPYPMSKRSGQYKHGHLAWNREALPFLRQVLSRCVSGTDPDYDCSNDEAAFNIATWEQELKVEELCLHDPDSSFWEFLYFDSKDINFAASAISEMFGDRTISFSLCHGIKNVTRARGILNALKRLFANDTVPWVIHKQSLMSLEKSASVSSYGLDKKYCHVV